MKTGSPIFSTSLILVLLLSGVANAATGIKKHRAPRASRSASRTMTKKITPSWTNNFTAQVYSLFVGPAVTNPLSAVQPNVDTGEPSTAKIEFQNTFTLGYKFTKKVTLSANFNIYVNPVYGGDYRIIDPFLRLSNSSVYKHGGFNLSTDLRLGAPLQERSVENKMITYLRNTWTPSYQIPHSRFSILVPSFLKGVAYTNYDKTGLTQIEAYTAPEIDYKLLPTVTLFALMELDAVQKTGSSLTDFSTSFTDVEPGVSWDVTPGFNLNVFLNIPTSNRVLLSTTQLDAAVTWKFF